MLYGFIALALFSKSWTYWGAFTQAIGAISCIGLFGYPGALFVQYQSTMHQAAKLIAYAADYQVIPAYSAMIPVARIRLHENGIMSIARLNADWKITITVANVSP